MSTPGDPGAPEPPEGGPPYQPPYQPPYPPQQPPYPPYGAVPPGPGAPPPAGPAGKPGNGLGLAALIVGIAAVVLAVIPVLSFVAWVPGLVAIGLGIGGLVARGRSRGTSIAGLVLGAVAVVLAIAVSIATAFGTIAIFHDVFRSATIGPLEPVPTPGGTPGQAVPDGASELVYEVETDGTTIDELVYATFVGGRVGERDDDDVPAPFSVRYELPAAGEGFSLRIFSLVATPAGDATTITCRITLDGVVVAEQTSTGPHTPAVCTASD